MLRIHTSCFLLVCLLVVLALTIPVFVQAQDSSVTVSKKVVTLKEVVVRNKMDINAFIQHVKNDTTFYKAFKNLRYNSIQNRPVL